MLRITLLLCLATGSFAQITFIGVCPSVDAVVEIDIHQVSDYVFKLYNPTVLSGVCKPETENDQFEWNEAILFSLYVMEVWHELASFVGILVPRRKCVTVNYSLNDNNTLSIRTDGIDPITGLEDTLTGLATFVGNTSVAKFTLTLPTLPSPTNLPFLIVGTDYINFNVVWSCVDNGLYSTQNAWLLTRERNPSQQTLDAAYAIFDANNISSRFLSKIDQTNC